MPISLSLNLVFPSHLILGVSSRVFHLYWSIGVDDHHWIWVKIFAHLTLCETLCKKKTLCKNFAHPANSFRTLCKIFAHPTPCKKKNVVRKPKDTLPSLCVTALTQRLQVTSIMQSYMEEVLPIISNYSMVI